MYLLDTNTVIDLFQERGNVAQRVFSIPPREIVLSSIVLYELRVGVAKSRRPEAKRRQIEELARHATLLPFGGTEAADAANIRAALEAEGRVIGPHDILIAATARANGLTLVTHNTGEFSRVEGLRIEDWL